MPTAAPGHEVPSRAARAGSRGPAEPPAECQCPICDGPHPGRQAFRLLESLSGRTTVIRKKASVETGRNAASMRPGLRATPGIGPAAPLAARAPSGWPSPRSGPAPRRSPGGGTHPPGTREYRPRRNTLHTAAPLTRMRRVGQRRRWARVGLTGRQGQLLAGRAARTRSGRWRSARRRHDEHRLVVCCTTRLKAADGDGTSAKFRRTAGDVTWPRRRARCDGIVAEQRGQGDGIAHDRLLRVVVVAPGYGKRPRR